MAASDDTSLPRSARRLALVATLLVATGPLNPSPAHAEPFGPDSITSPDTTGDVGFYTSIALDTDGNPIISYTDLVNGDLKVLGCTNTDCSGTQTPQAPDTTDHVGSNTSIALDANGNPVIAYTDLVNGDLKVLHCSASSDCFGPQTPHSPDTAGDVGYDASLALDSDGYPVIAYQDGPNGDLKVLHCTNPNCSGTQTPHAPDTTDDVGSNTSIALDANGNPVIAYYDFTNGDLKVLHCTNPNCSGTQTPHAADTNDDVGYDASLALDANGNPVIAYYDSTNGNLKVLHCTNPNCSGTQTPHAADTNGNVGSSASLALDANGNPVIAYYDSTNGNLKVLHCYDPETCGGQDQDGDGVAHATDNCPTTANAGQADKDNDGLGNACDPIDNRIPATCSAFQGANVIIGTNAANTLTGTSGRDVILGRGGSDTIDGKDGNDCIVGGDGNDTITGGDGHDRIRGDLGRDVITGGDGNDALQGNDGPDTVSGNAGNDTLIGGAGIDSANGGAGTDTCRAETEPRCER